MPAHTKELLDKWVAEFRDAHSGSERIHVIIQDGDDGADTGLVVVPLQNATTSVFVQPREIRSAQWCIFIEAQPDVTELSSAELHELAAELTLTADLCAFLEQESAAHTR